MKDFSRNVEMENQDNFEQLAVFKQFLQDTQTKFKNQKFEGYADIIESLYKFTQDVSPLDTKLT